MTELEKQQAKEIQELKKLLGLIEEDKPKAFSGITLEDLEKMVDIKQRFGNHNKFDKWFKNDLEITDDKKEFLENLLNKYGEVLSNFNEDRLKVKFIGSILENIDFMDKDLEIGDFYHSPLKFKKDKINFNGFCDFCVARGIKSAKTPYFFIQEFKQEEGATEPEPQLIAELICAVELNNWKIIKGAYIKGAIWRFVILEKLDENKYQYFVSKDFLSTRIEDLKDIYKNLLFVKNEIIEIVKKENEKL